MSNETPETMWAGKYITVKKQGTWEFVSRSRGIRAAVILPIEDHPDHGPRLILVEQYRVPLGKSCLELPAGLIGDDDSASDEAPLDAAIRELEEETGYRAAQMIDLGEFFSSPGMVSESFTLFRARGLVKIHEGGGVSGENITVHAVPISQIAAYVADRRAEGMVMDVKLLIALGAGMIGD